MPPAIGPPAPILNGNSIFPRAPPVAARTIPVLRKIVLTPASSAAEAALSHSLHTSGRKPCPISLVSVSSSLPLSPYQPIALARMNDSGFLSRDTIASVSNLVLLTLLSLIICLRLSFQRFSPMGSPPRWMITSNPLSRLGSKSPLSGSQRISLAPGFRVLLTNLQTS